MYPMGHANTGCLNDDSVPLSYIFVLKCSTTSSSHDFAKACYQIFIPNLLCHLLSYSMLRAFYLAQSRAQTGFEVDHISPFRTLVQQQLQQTDPSQISCFSSPSPYRNDCIFFPTLSDPSWFGSTPNFCPYYRLCKFLSLFPALQGEYITCTWLPRIRHISTCQDWSQARGEAWKINSTALCPEQLASKEGESVAKTYSSK